MQSNGEDGMTPSDLLDRLALMLKGELGPNIKDDYAKTQAYLGAVVLQKLAGQLRLEKEHETAETSDRRALQADLERLVSDLEAPPAVREAVSSLSADGQSGLCRLIEALYAERDGMEDDSFAVLLGRVRQDLRRSLDRRMEYSS
jgi:hypothetical protein